MKTKLYFMALTMAFTMTAIGQINPVQNLTWEWAYENMHNVYQLNWEEPAQPHDALLGYNIYRNDELYRFQTETTLYYVYADIFGSYMTNDTGEFLLYFNGSQSNPQEFDIHVTAVYGPDGTESGYTQTHHCFGAALSATAFTQEKAVLYPNPTTGVLNLGSSLVTSVVVYDVMGKTVGEYAAQSALDLSGLAKGVYVVKLYSQQGVRVERVVLH